MFKADPIPFGPFTKGVNNRLPDVALGTEKLRNGVNIDIDNSGRIHRRKGAVNVAAGASVRSAYAYGERGPIYYADGAALKRFIPNGAPPYSAEYVAAVTAGAPVAYESYAGILFWTDGTLTGQVINGVNRAWGIQPAVNAPNMAQVTGGLFDGQYQATFTYMRIDGEESGAPMSNQITISHHDRSQDGTAGILLSGIVASLDPTVVQINLYCTGANGTTLFKVGTMGNTAGTFLVTAIDAVAGQQLATQFFLPPPAGNTLFGHGARMYIAAGKFLYYSERFAPGWFSPAFNFLSFGADIAVAIPVKDGVYVATSDEQYFLPGLDPEKMKLDRILRYGAVKGSGVVIKNGERVAWMGQRGLVIAEPGGQVKAVQEEEVAVELATQGVTGYREVNGIRQLVSIMFDGTPSPMANKDFTAQEARRVATTLPTE